MNILLTNDDGIESEGILYLAKALRSRGKYRVYVLAPDSNRSGVSHGLSIFSEPIKLIEKSKDTWACSGLPADCVIAAALGGRPCKPDIIVSGINHGANLGNDITYSGTAAAARQGAFFGLPSIALSLNGWANYNWSMAAEYSADHLEDFLEIWEKDIFINVNIPNSPEGPVGMKTTWPGRKDYHDSLSVMQGPDGNEWCFLIPGEQTTDDEKGSDLDAVSANFVSVSPVFIHPVILKGRCPNVPEHAATGRREGSYVK
jgi:5'-nucleotidase